MSHRGTYLLLAGCLALAATAPLHLNAAAASAAAVAVPAAQGAFVTQYCMGCHSNRLKTGGLTLEPLLSAALGDRTGEWEKVLQKVRSGLMPPAGQPRPDAAGRRAFVTTLETALDGLAAVQPNPGRTESLHRLKRAEYRNAVRDLLALDLDVAALLPADDASYGFDNIAGVLKINQSLMESYLAAARKISRTAMGGRYPVPK